MMDRTCECLNASVRNLRTRPQQGPADDHEHRMEIECPLKAGAPGQNHQVQATNGCPIELRAATF
eukprot:CAMPEP_0117556100 /NCGR_PEP_ID=MMETSP0784-20121206/51626_1 /TAXON_ID=39447 /ORGANISM="" /LENGTH=64 /DNA_ID=CAMNT_0005353347 /DNA_START=504 /DNA_END=698 /DNA_ORIENTATION=+